MKGDVNVVQRKDRQEECWDKRALPPAKLLQRSGAPGRPGWSVMADSASCLGWRGTWEGDEPRGLGGGGALGLHFQKLGHENRRQGTSPGQGQDSDKNVLQAMEPGEAERWSTGSTGQCGRGGRRRPSPPSPARKEEPGCTQEPLPSTYVFPGTSPRDRSRITQGVGQGDTRMVGWKKKKSKLKTPQHFRVEEF